MLELQIKSFISAEESGTLSGTSSMFLLKLRELCCRYLSFWQLSGSRILQIAMSSEQKEKCMHAAILSGEESQKTLLCYCNLT